MNAPHRPEPGLTHDDGMSLMGDMLVHGRLLPLRLRELPVLDRQWFKQASCREMELEPHVAARLFRTFFSKNFSVPEADAPLSVWVEACIKDMEGRPESISFQSSGSTGMPTSHTLAYSLLAHEAQVMAPLLPARRVISIMPRYHCFGFVFALLLPRYAGIPSLQFLPLPTHDFIHSLREGDMVVSFPFFWNAVIRLNVPLPPVFILSAGSPCPHELADTLLRRGVSEVREIYGASELGAVGRRNVTPQGNSANIPFTLLPHWQRVDTGAETLIARVLPPERSTVPQGEGMASPVEPPDLLNWSGKREFVPLARRDKAVQVGSRNLYPGRVAAKIEEHPRVRHCRARLMRPDEGQRLKAFVVLDPADPALADEKEFATLCAELKQLCAKNFESHSVPRRFSAGASLPLSPTGKDADW